MTKLEQLEELKKYKELLDLGILTEEEFQQKKQEVLAFCETDAAEEAVQTEPSVFKPREETAQPMEEGTPEPTGEETGEETKKTETGTDEAASAEAAPGEPAPMDSEKNRDAVPKDGAPESTTADTTTQNEKKDLISRLEAKAHALKETWEGYAPEEQKKKKKVLFLLILVPLLLFGAFKITDTIKEHKQMAAFETEIAPIMQSYDIYDYDVRSAQGSCDIYSTEFEELTMGEGLALLVELEEVGEVDEDFFFGPVHIYGSEGFYYYRISSLQVANPYSEVSVPGLYRSYDRECLFECEN